MRPLTALVNKLQAPNYFVPNFDPLDGGIRAEVLFLFEKPGPKTAPDHGSGFISRNNDDPTAEAVFGFMQRAGLNRERTILWNVIPGWDGQIKISPGSLRQGIERLHELLKLLPALRAIVFVGKKAARARPLVRGEYYLTETPHPSPKVHAIYPERWNAIAAEWEAVRRWLDGTGV